MDWGAFSAGMAVGGTIIAAFALWYQKRDGERITTLRRIIKHQADEQHRIVDMLYHLRANAYLTNEHGHRVRYHKASAEVRARAEAGE